MGRIDIFFNAFVPCGFPSPADDYLEDDIDLVRLLNPRPASTFYVWAKGKSMTGAGILEGALLVIDRSLNAENNDIVLAVVHGEFTVKYFIVEKDGAWLTPANDSYKSIRVDVMDDVIIWGVITWFINKSQHRNKKRSR